MKVLKFGGAALCSPELFRKVKEIIEEETAVQPVVAVVSAIGKVTDELLQTAHEALEKNQAWQSSYQHIAELHIHMAEMLFDGTEKLTSVLHEIQALLGDLHSIYLGVSLVGDLSRHTEDVIASYGERLAARLLYHYLAHSSWVDALQIVKTNLSDGKHIPDFELSGELIKQAFDPRQNLYTVAGFIAQDATTGEVTNLGRGGSDYTASIIAAALKAEELVIWTDTDGFMTADPKVIKGAYTISELSYREAMELCNFDASVLYPPTIYPVCIEHIPLTIRNIHNTSCPGTVIKDSIANDGKPIKGISSISHTTLINVSGLSMVGVVGVNRRIFETLANSSISVFFVAQAASENSTSIAVQDEDAESAVRVLNAAFAQEIADGRMFPMEIEKDLATIGVVGENMKHTPGIAGKLFEVLGRSGITVMAFAQGASETNISFVVRSEYLKKSLNVIHDSFFLSEFKELNLFICGIGTVGGKLIEQIARQYDTLKQNSRLKLNVVGIASSKKAVYNKEGLSPENYRTLMPDSPNSNIGEMIRNILSMNIFNAVFVDCTASKEVANEYLTLLQHNISVITANKIAASSHYENYKRLKDTALKHGVKFRFETNVGAGLPIIGTINDLRNSGDNILKIEAVLSGTLNFIFNEISSEVTFSEAVKRAKEYGYSEPDPRIDLSGGDVVRKLVILTREAGYRIDLSDVEKELFIPQELFDTDIETFWEQLPRIDQEMEERRKRLEAEDKKWRFVAEMQHGKATVRLKAVDRTSPFYTLEGSNNVVLLTTERYKEYPMQIQGYGAGADVTAAGVLANIMSIANI